MTKLGHGWINFSDRKPDGGQEIDILGIKTAKPFKGVYGGCYCEEYGWMITPEEVNEIYFKIWKPAQPEIQGSSASNTQELNSNTREFEKKDCAFETVRKNRTDEFCHCGNPIISKRCMVTFYLQLEHFCGPVCPLSEYCTICDKHLHTKPKESIHDNSDMHNKEQECEHIPDFISIIISTQPNEPAKHVCSKCGEGFVWIQKSQSQIAIEKVIEACVRAQKELADVGLVDRGLRAFHYNLMEMMEEELN